jgi:hypothetical protein
LIGEELRHRIFRLNAEGCFRFPDA